MKTAVPAKMQNAKASAEASKEPRQSFPMQQSGHPAQLAAMMNQSPQVQTQLKLAEDIRNSEPVQNQLGLAAEINQFQPIVQEKQGRVRPTIQMEKGVAVNDDAKASVQRAQHNSPAVRGSRSQRIIQRMEVKGEDGNWVQKEVKIAACTPEEVKDIRDNLYSELFRSDGKYKLTRAEMRELEAREREIRNSEAARRLREEEEQKNDSASLERLRQSFRDAKEWKLVGDPSHMGESDRGFRQNWEIAFDIGGQGGVLHLHFNTNERKEINRETLGRAHIKTRLTSKAGNFEAPEGMVTKAIEAIPKS